MTLPTQLCSTLRALTVVVLLFPQDTSALEDHALWTIEECGFQTGQDHPVSYYSPNIISLARMNYYADSFYLQFSWSAEPLVSCGLQHNVLYHVQRNLLDGFDAYSMRYIFKSYGTYLEWLQTKDDTRGEISCGESIVALDEGSYGFVTCEKDYGRALQLARDWRAGVPNSFFLTLSIVIAVVVLLVSIVGLVTLFVSKKKCSGKFSFHDSRLNSKLSSPQATTEPPDA